MVALKQNKQRRNGFIVSSLFLFLLAIGLGKVFLHDFDEQAAIENIQQAVIEKDKILTEEIKQLNEIHQQYPDSVFSYFNHNQYKSDPEKFAFVIRQNDSIVFWSDNRIPLSFFSGSTYLGLVETGNGWYRHIMLYDDDHSYSGFYLIKHNYNYQNEYLINNFNKTFELDCRADIYSSGERGYPIYDQNGYILFSIQFHPEKNLTGFQLFILFFLYTSGLLLFIGFIYEIYLFIFRRSKKHLLFVGGFIIDLIIIRVLIFYLRIPHVLFDTPLFGPQYYAFSDLIPSIGDLFLHVLFILIAAFFFFTHVKFKQRKIARNLYHRLFIIFTLFMHVFIFFGGILFLYSSLIIDSNISLDLNNIFSLSWMSLFSFLILSMAILAFVLITSRLCYFAWSYSGNIKTYVFLSLVVFIIFLLICFSRIDCDPIYTGFVFLYILSTGLFFRYRSLQFNLPNIVFQIIFFSLITTYALHENTGFKEQEYRKLLAVHLASEQRDPLAEYMFFDIERKILADDTLSQLLSNYNTENFKQQKLEKYFFSEYFTGYWKKFDHQLTVCNSDDVLMIQPEDVPVECFIFFENMITTIGEQTSAQNFSFINYGAGDNGYIAIFTLPAEANGIIRLFVELTPKYIAKDLGFPDLLVDEKVTQSPDFSDYSYAKYEDGELYKRVGKYFYNFNIENYGDWSGQFMFFNMNGYSHLYYKIDKQSELLISKKNKSLLDLLAPFSYLFIAFALFIGIVFLIFIYPFSHRKMKLSFRTRLQLSMSAVILFSFVVIGIFTLWYINNLNDEKNKDTLSEKTHSVLVEMQHKFSDTDKLDDDVAFYLNELLVKFSNVFFTDINLFKLNGSLLATSRPQIYDEKLIGSLMNPEAYYELKYQKSSLFIHDENIGLQHYLSAYIPFLNNQNEVIAYLNLPYFAKENDLKREISSFLVAYINIYVILIAVSILFALLISNYISRPLKLIMQKIREVKLIGQNEKIEWSRRDEIGQLVNEYNRMIDELASSAELLARSERETAWREMAKQVAHEIKNPLTPMKLSVQYLQRSWKEKRPDWELRLDKFTKTMIDQIETLSAIASEFSDFAKMPVSRKTDSDLCDILQNSISIFRNYNNISINLHYDHNCRYMVFADKEQLLRAFNNLLKNSVQAIGDDPDGQIDISLQKSQNKVFITITDNGGGIPEDFADKIFSPNFTTKSGGMGLGLAIVKNVITLSGGEISFESTEGRGTTFRISLPLSDTLS